MNLSYIAEVVFMLYLAIQTYRESTDPMFNKLFWWNVIPYFFGAACWITEKFFCLPLLPFTLYLHSIWHLAAGYGTYVFITSNVYARAASIGKVKVDFEPLLAAPYVVIHKTN
eukprot:TRINITY_DN8220_c0_g1_i1.p1 TRINITY_DN8220_c0_g1~~TRINITY_DN8220_c0_g1_i1.p1  ORF type:complete len:113 (+),score=12.01 TRINITY_DN8220_c0_g1_i1:499-837(+)